VHACESKKDPHEFRIQDTPNIFIKETPVSLFNLPYCFRSLALHMQKYHAIIYRNPITIHTRKNIEKQSRQFILIEVFI
jgi:hypothetical protein